MKMLNKIWQRLLVSTLLLLGLAAAVEAADVYVMTRNSEGVKGTAYVYRTTRGSFMYLVSSYGEGASPRERWELYSAGKLEVEQNADGSLTRNFLVTYASSLQNGYGFNYRHGNLYPIEVEQEKLPAGATLEGEMGAMLGEGWTLGAAKTLDKYVEAPPEGRYSFLYNDDADDHDAFSDTMAIGYFKYFVFNQEDLSGEDSRSYSTWRIGEEKSRYTDIPQAYDYIQVTVYGEPGEGYYLLENHGRLIYRINKDKTTTKLFDERSF